MGRGRGQGWQSKLVDRILIVESVCADIMSVSQGVQAQIVGFVTELLAMAEFHVVCRKYGAP